MPRVRHTDPFAIALTLRAAEDYDVFMTRTVSIQDLQAHTADLLAGIAADEEIIVEQNGQPLAKISAMPGKPAAKRGERQLGMFKGQIWVAPDFDDELPEEFWCPPDDPLTK